VASPSSTAKVSGEAHQLPYPHELYPWGGDFANGATFYTLNLRRKEGSQGIVRWFSEKFDHG